MSVVAKNTEELGARGLVDPVPARCRRQLGNGPSRLVGGRGGAADEIPVSHRNGPGRSQAVEVDRAESGAEGGGTEDPTVEHAGSLDVGRVAMGSRHHRLGSLLGLGRAESLPLRHPSQVDVLGHLTCEIFL